MKSLRVLLTIAAISGIIAFTGVADTPPTLPSDPAEAQVAALELLKSKGFHVLHQIEGSVADSGAVLLQERWIDLAGTEYRIIRWLGEKSKLPNDPLENVEFLRATEPSGGSWRTSLGDLRYRSGEGRWDPVKIQTGDPHKTVFRRLTKEWYFGSFPTPDGKTLSEAPTQLAARLKRMQSGEDPMSIKEKPDGLLEEIRLRRNNETIALVKNEFLNEYPAMLDPELEVTLNQWRGMRPVPGIFAKPAQTGAAVRGHGMGISPGNIVRVVIEGSPAARAGIAPDDKLLSINGTPLNDNPVNTADILRRFEEATVEVEKADGTRSKIILQKAKPGN
jgi:hypothetical protein